MCEQLPRNHNLCKQKMDENSKLGFSKLHNILLQFYTVPSHDSEEQQKTVSHGTEVAITERKSEAATTPHSNESATTQHGREEKQQLLKC